MSDLSGLPQEAHECYPTNERFPVCVTCARRMDTSPGGDADRAWFKRQRQEQRERDARRAAREGQQDA